MRICHAGELVCPACIAPLRLLITEREQEGEEVVAGRLDCLVCRRTYEIGRGIPRFVRDSAYTSSFGFQWKRHGPTQRDSHSGRPISETRFFAATQWPRRLDGQRILEIGGGAGRFTEQAARTGAFVASVDYSEAVETNRDATAGLDNVLVVQADLHALPFRQGSFDKVFCFGVLQHTPAPERAFMAIAPMLRPGGELVIDVYRKSVASTVLHGKYYARALTRRMNPVRLHALVSAWIDLAWPCARVIGRIPRLGPAVLQRLLVPYYSSLGLDDAGLKEWALLDAFDMLSPRYDNPQRLADVRRWLHRAGLTHANVRNGYNGILARGRAPVAAHLPASGGQPQP